MRLGGWESVTVAACCALLLPSCAKNRLVVSGPPTPVAEAKPLTVVPAERDPSLTVDFLDESVRQPLSYVLIPPRALRSWLGEQGRSLQSDRRR